MYGLNVPIDAMNDALERAKNVNEPSEDREQLSAELQRKSCLLLGALADGDTYMATRLVDEGALHTILNALDWYRFHEDLANWALWALFILCYDHTPNKAQLLRLGGVKTICHTMSNIPESLEVARHGIAVLFDMLREVPEKPTDVAKIREIAIGAGLHDTVRMAMDEFPESMEVMAMGQEMLVATGYQGDIPVYQPTS